ncbi:hypothetical protein [Jannaschia sp. W003]|uniref:hypothetical protein n=1 Tax=Jannaschia sp. W003 TaxID=2867012 RepID=UPI0021A92F83|nr:hypothetical protein [Jannaschia sp. W003]UWQ20711.1 hypothetical protein K3554_12075 [Jannaschia sp. W003]
MNAPEPQARTLARAVDPRGGTLLGVAVLDAVRAVGGGGTSAGWLAIDCAAQLVALAEEALGPDAPRAQREALAAATAALRDAGAAE